MAKKSGQFTIQDIVDADISSWSRQELEKNLPKMVKKYNDRARSFTTKKNKNLFSYALDKMKSQYPKGVRLPQSTGDDRKFFNQEQILAYRIQEFFRSKTSSTSGAREVQREQDIRIFGTDVFGNPKRRMTYSERETFWSYYDEFMAQHDEWSRGSFRVLEVLGEMTADGSLKKFGKFLSSGALNEAAERYRAKMEGREPALDRKPEKRRNRREVVLLTIEGINDKG